jgi:hypothetical protein
MLPETVKSTPLVVTPLVLGAGPVWLLGAHPDKSTLPARTTDKANTNPFLQLNNDNTPPKEIEFLGQDVTGGMLREC